jgi:hypothetical protein
MARWFAGGVGPLVSAFDRIVIAVPDLTDAAAEYERLLGVAPLPPAEPAPHPALWLALPNTLLELRERSIAQPAIAGVVFSAPCGFAPRFDDRQLGLSLSDGQATRQFRLARPEAQCRTFCVDHLVLRTADSDACIDLFATTLGIRLALDRTVPEWGGRMLFFRTGKLTLEVIDSGADMNGHDRFWGIAFQCRDIERSAAEMMQRGVAVSAVRDGRKPGTRVATVKSGCLGIPTLLIEQAP